MQSEVLDTIEVSEEYQAGNGETKTRTHTVRSMSNGGSQFINFRVGRSSMNLSRGIWKDISKAVDKLGWETSKKQETKKQETDVNAELMKHIQQLQRQITDMKKGDKKK